MKKCFKCNLEKSYDEFYRHKQMRDGHLGKCKDCTKSDAINVRNNNIEYYREYDRKRGSRRSKEDLKKYRERYPNKYKAHTMVSNAIRDGKLFKESCEVCGTEKNIHAHHDDYSKPLNVRFLCAVHHFEWHKENGEGKNA